MPSVSKSQQRLFGWVHAVQKGEAKNAPEKIKRIASSISKKDAKHFAETKHDGLPDKKKKKMKKESMHMTAYERGFLDKCAEHEVPYDDAERMLKIAQVTNAVPAVAAAPAATPAVAASPAVVQPSETDIAKAKELAGHIAEAGSMWRDDPRKRAPYTIQSSALSQHIVPNRRAYEAAVKGVGMPAFSNLLNRAIAERRGFFPNTAYELWDDYVQDALKPGPEDIEPREPPQQELPPWATDPNWDGWADPIDD